MRKRYDSYKDSGVEWMNEIPSKWERSRIRMVGELYGGLTGKKGDDFNNDDNPSNRPFIPFTNIFNNTYISKDHFQLVNVEDDENQNRVLKNDLFFLMSSESYEDLGKCSILLEDVEELYLNSFCKGFRIKDSSVYPLFLNYQLLGSLHKEMISIEGNGFTRINLRQDRLLDIPVFIPPLSEQQQIVSFLDTKTSLIDSLIEKTQRKIELLKEKRTSLINEVVTKGLNPNVEMKDSGVEWIGEIPSHWGRTKLKRYVSIFTGYSFKSDWFGEVGIPVIRISNIQDGFIDFTKSVYLTENYLTEYPDYVVKRDDTLICLTGSLTGKVGKFNHEVGLLNQRVGKIIVRGNKVLKGFVDKVFFFQKFQGLIKELGEGISENFPNVSHLDVVELEIPLPSLSEQQQIVSYLDEQTQKIDKTISIEEKRIELLKEYRQSLISEVVTGKRKVLEC